jgi:subtilisin family serine protease
MAPLDLVRLGPLIDRTSGTRAVAIGLIDGPVVMDHPEFANQNVREIPGNGSGTCNQADSMACMHGTFVAGILSAKRGSVAPAICPGCTLLVRPIFAETTAVNRDMPTAKPEDLAQAILDCIDAGARVLNVSAALAQSSIRNEHTIKEALDLAARRGVIVIVAAGNQGTLGSSCITHHSWVIPVVACNLAGRPTNETNFGRSIGRHGLSGPGDCITSLGAKGQSLTLGGTSAAAPFVTGAIALLWSEFPAATATQIKLAISQTTTSRRASVVPPLLDAAAAYQSLLTSNARRRSP